MLKGVVTLAKFTTETSTIMHFSRLQAWVRSVLKIIKQEGTVWSGTGSWFLQGETDFEILI
jgi:hypothetical protein